MGARDFRVIRSHRSREAPIFPIDRVIDQNSTRGERRSGLRRLAQGDVALVRVRESEERRLAPRLREEIHAHRRSVRQGLGSLRQRRGRCAPLPWSGAHRVASPSSAPMRQPPDLTGIRHCWNFSAHLAMWPYVAIF